MYSACIVKSAVSVYSLLTQAIGVEPRRMTNPFRDFTAFGSLGLVEENIPAKLALAKRLRVVFGSQEIPSDSFEGRAVFFFGEIEKQAH